MKLSVSILYRSISPLCELCLAPPLWEFVTSGRTEPPPPNTPSIKLEGGRRKERRGQIDGGAYRALGKIRIKLIHFIRGMRFAWGSIFRRIPFKCPLLFWKKFNKEVDCDITITMGSKRHRSKISASSHNPKCSPVGLSLLILLPLSVAFNLDVENPAVYNGPNGSYFGYSVDFYMTGSR